MAGKKLCDVIVRVKVSKCVDLTLYFATQMHEHLHDWKELFKRSTMALTKLSGDVCDGSYARSKFWTSMPGCTITMALTFNIVVLKQWMELVTWPVDKQDVQPYLLRSPLKLYH